MDNDAGNLPVLMLNSMASLHAPLPTLRSIEDVRRSPGLRCQALQA
jgi:hypothetical protein